MDARSLLEHLANTESEVITLPVAIQPNDDIPAYQFYQQLSAIFSQKKFKRINLVGFDQLTIDNIETSKEGLLTLLQFNIAHLHFDFLGQVEIANIYYDVINEFIHQLKQISAVFPLLTCCLDAGKTDKYNALFYNLTIQRLSSIAIQIDIVSTLVRLGQALEDQNRSQEALAFYNLAAQQFPRNKLVHYYRGWLYSKNVATYGLALADFTRLFQYLEFAPDKNYEECALFARGSLYIKISEAEPTEKLKHLQSAKRDFEALLAIKNLPNVKHKECYQKKLASIENGIKGLQSPITQHGNTLFSFNDSDEDVCIPDEAFDFKLI